VCCIFPYALTYTTLSRVVPLLTRVPNPVLQNKLLLPYLLSRNEEPTAHKIVSTRGRIRERNYPGSDITPS